MQIRKLANFLALIRLLRHVLKLYFHFREQAIADCVAKYATLTLSELQTELNSVKDSKKSLQKFLKEFEHDFEKKHGNYVRCYIHHHTEISILYKTVLPQNFTTCWRLTCDAYC